MNSLASIVWTGSLNSAWDTSSTNWVVQGGGATQYIDSPGDSVIFNDLAAQHQRRPQLGRRASQQRHVCQ